MSAPRHASSRSIRRSLGVTGERAARGATAVARAARRSHPRGVIPARGQLPPAERVEAVRRDGRGRGRHGRRSLPSADDVPAAVAALSAPAQPADADPPRRRSAARRAAVGHASARSRSRPAPSDGHRRSSRSATPSPASPRPARWCMASGPDNPTTLNFLPDTHIVVVDAKDIAGDYETVWAAHAREIRRRRAAAHGQHDHRPVALRRHRADPDPRRARAAPAACAGG